MAMKKKRAAKKTARKPAAKGATVRRPATRKSAPRRRVPAKPARTPSAPEGAGAAKTVKRTIARASGEALRLAGIGTDAVARATGRAWDQWLAILDNAGAVAMPHKAIAGLLAEKYGLPSWWSQMVTVGYEQARGLREAHEKPDGFTATASRTVGASLERLFRAWEDASLRSLWLGAAPAEMRTARRGKSMRFAWKLGESSVVVNFHPKGEGRSQVTVEHNRLPGRKAVDEQKSFWGDSLGRLKSLLEKAA
jgi:uncharacterized protein YndB with AHSA1/START domain